MKTLSCTIQLTQVFIPKDIYYDILTLKIHNRDEGNTCFNSIFLTAEEKLPTFIASMAYSTWNSRPSGEKVFTPRSYSDLVRNMFSI